jgi:hypothetical protein
MRYIVTEEQLSRQELYQIKWKRFEKFMKRRGDEIKDLISQHTHAYTYDIERYDEDIVVSSVLSMVISEFIVNNDLAADDDVEYDWVHYYIEDNYKDYIKKELGL